jgi:uncharacterized membrane protein YfcA
MVLISDPIFYFAAIPAVAFLGMSKGGFSGAGMIATPLLALVLPPLQAAAILLSILLLQDVISVYVYRRDWDIRNIKVMLPGAVIGIGFAWLLAAHVSDTHVRLAVGMIALGFVISHWLGRRPTVMPPPPQTQQREPAAASQGLSRPPRSTGPAPECNRRTHGSTQPGW